MESKPFVITIVGPESSGKTTLARQLAADMGCPWVPEYAREYLEVLGREYNEADLSVIAEGQWAVICEQLAVFPPSPLLGVSDFEALQQTLEEKEVLTFYREDFGDESRSVIIIDSGMMGMRMWAKIKYNITIPVVEEALREDMTSMYILCRPVLPWEQDPLREAPTLLDRAWIYNQYLKEIFLSQEK